jgi:selenocysteine lyase/cysteine desulfurase
MIDKNIKKQLFDEKLSVEIRNKFYHVDLDPISNHKRIFLDNAGGALRLKAASDRFKELDELPDCPEHSNKTALWLEKIHSKGKEDIRILLNASLNLGSVITSLTASMIMFDMVRTIIDNVSGDNVVITKLAHPSAYDSVVKYAEKAGKEVRVAETNTKTGGVDVEEITKLIDENTCLLNCIYASNISGSVLDIESLVKESRKIKSDLYIACDAVQHIPHGLVDLEKTPVDAINFGPYKFGAPRGIGIGYMSDRASKLPHDKLTAKSLEIDWELGSSAPAHFAAITELVNHVCWVGKKFINSSDRRKLFAEGMTKINSHEKALLYHMLNGTQKSKGLREISGVKVLLDHEDLSNRDLIIELGFENLNYTEAVKKYEKEGIIVFERLATSPYSKRMLKSFDIDGGVRVSPLHCHNIRDIEKFLEITQKISKL